MALNNKLIKALDAYDATLAEFSRQYVLHEGATSVAFQTLLADVGRTHHWSLIPQLTDKKAGKHVRPDGTLKDIFGLVRGHWEAKDTKDDLTEEVAKKTKKGYPLGNIIFEDTREAILIQNKQQVMRIDLKNRDQIDALFDAFFSYIEPQIESFEKAVTEFKERVPDIALHLKKYIEKAHRGNGKTGTERVLPIKKFNDAFAAFMEVCRTALNPNLTEAAVDDMLVQHLMTERLIREIFDNPEFTRRNVIAAEIEKVIDALTSRSFDRNVFLKSLDRFYLAIENAARTITEWSDKQHFLNTIYERFFQGYNVKLADTMGVVYTPQPIVDFMCASVVEVLEKEFGRSLGDPGVNILDPCTGTGNFIVNLLRRVPKKDLPRVYREQLFANEIMLLPYYIAALNIEHAYYEQTGEYEPFEGLCFVDTLDLAESHQAEMSFMTAKNTERVERQKNAPITVIIGNPPYNVGQMANNEQNANRGYAEIDRRIKATYTRGSAATSVSKLNDPYIKFFRWASDRIGKDEGVVCFVSNSSFVDKLPFDAMRRELFADFDLLYVTDLQGDVRKDSMRDGIPLGEQHTVFGLAAMVGICVSVFVRRRPTRKSKQLRYFTVPFRSKRPEKFRSLTQAQSVSGIEWTSVTPDKKHNWLIAAETAAFESGLPLSGKEMKRLAAPECVMPFYTLGVATHRDAVVYDYQESTLKQRAEQFAENYNIEVDRFKRAGAGKTAETFVDHSKIVWDRDLKRDVERGNYAKITDDKIRQAQYRPFTRKTLLFDRILNAEVYSLGKAFPKHESLNSAIMIGGYGRKLFTIHITDRLPDLNFYSDPGQCFPFYVYDEDGSNRRENITDWSLDQFRTQYKDKTITKWDIFHYVYGLLHHPGYRTKFADNLKRELPRIPMAPDFRAFATAGERLAKLHLDYEQLEPWPLKWIETPGVPLSYRVDHKMKLNKDKTVLTVNPSLTLAEIPPEAKDYRLGNRSALEWVINQYWVSTDKRSGIVSDPNRDEDETYIVRLVGQVIRVSVETVKVVNALPAEYNLLES